MGERGPRRPDDERHLFEAAVGDVQPLEGRSRRLPSRPRPEGRRRAEPLATVHFEIESFGQQIEGLAQGADRGQLRRLRNGELPVEAELDLHGLDEEQARRAVHGALRGALGSGLRCLLIVHGRGLRSVGAPVLKEALPGWLTELPLGRHVLAFTTAPPRRGGGGATLVLLRRSRRRSRRSG